MSALSREERLRKMRRELYIKRCAKAMAVFAALAALSVSAIYFAAEDGESVRGRPSDLFGSDAEERINGQRRLSQGQGGEKLDQAELSRRARNLRERDERLLGREERLRARGEGELPRLPQEEDDRRLLPQDQGGEELDKPQEQGDERLLPQGQGGETRNEAQLARRAENLREREERLRARERRLRARDDGEPPRDEPQEEGDQRLLPQGQGGENLDEAQLVRKEEKLREKNERLRAREERLRARALRENEEAADVLPQGAGTTGPREDESQDLAGDVARREWEEKERLLHFDPSAESDRIAEEQRAEMEQKRTALEKQREAFHRATKRLTGRRAAWKRRENQRRKIATKARLLGYAGTPEV